jgi:hypothetical protein
MIGSCRDHEGARLNRESVVFPHEPRHPCMVHPHPAPPEFCRDAPVTIPTLMGAGDSLKGRPPVPVFCHRLLRAQRPINPRSADLRQMTHPFDTQGALPRHHVPDVGVDACAPAMPFRWRRASTVCTAPLKKSTSRTFSAHTRLSWWTSCRSVASRECSGGPLRSRDSSFSRHGYHSRRLMPNAFARATMLSHGVSRFTAMCRKAVGNFPLRFFATCHPLVVPSVPIGCVSI